MTHLLVGPLLRHVGTTDATIWVETDEPCEVEVLGCTQRTWTIAGHHYALVVVDGLEPAANTAYEVRLDGELVWPLPDSSRPPSRIRTQGGQAQLRFAFGSCRYGRASVALADKHFDPDALACYARLLAAQDDPLWPDAVFLLGDQVYADETSDATRRRIRAKRDITQGSKDQVADFEEYTWLYLESWTDPDVRWLLSTIPSSMIFDDHDVRDDWNTSHLWREDMQATSWWAERIVGGLSSYWVYQHIGNLSPDDLRENELFQKVRSSVGDAEPPLREFARHADAEADGAKGTRWSFRRDFGRVRLVMIDSRCGRILAEGERSMVSEDEFAWIEQQVHGDYDHLLVGTSLPWLMARALHDIESWDEQLCAGAHGPRWARFGEKLRRASDLEHWASFHKSFDRLGELLASVARGERTETAPATICVLSGDVHHAYVAEAQFERPVQSKVYQLTCSPLHNRVPTVMKVAFRASWSRVAERVTRRLLATVAKLPPVAVTWTRLSGPFFGNELAEITFTGRRAEAMLRRSAPKGDAAQFVDVDTRWLA
ncbi:MAG: alkaline phosphatase family protein [Actinomycetota bacterium]|nr:alkaline phosphatase family protein [Actinomycetota bacterium]